MSPAACADSDSADSAMKEDMANDFIVAPLFLLRVIGSDVGDVLVRQAGGDAAHGGMLALALLVRIERVLDVLCRLAAQHGHLVHLGERCLVAWNAVATDTVCNLVFCRCRTAFRVRGCGDLGNTRKREKC